MKAVKIHPSGQLEKLDIPNTLEAVQEAVGGFVQQLRTIFPGTVLLVDEDGRQKGLVPNPAAMRMCPGALGGIIGPALMVGDAGEDWGDLDPDVASAVALLT